MSNQGRDGRQLCPDPSPDEIAFMKYLIRKENEDAIMARAENSRKLYDKRPLDLRPARIGE